MKKIWNWLLVNKNRQALSLLGAGIAVLVAAGWTYFTYYNSRTNKSKTETVTNIRHPLILRNRQTTPKRHMQQDHSLVYMLV